MANNRNYNNSGSSLGAIITLTALAALLALIIGWATSWFTDWTFSRVTETVSALFPAADDTGTDDGSSSSSGSGSSSSSGSSDNSDSSSTADEGDYTISQEVLTSSSFDYVLIVDYPTSADEGETVSLTITVTGDCEVGNIIIVGCDDGEEIDYSTFSGGKYSFVMPAQDVVITIYLTEVEDDTEAEDDSSSDSSSGGYAGGGYGGGGGSGR